MAQYFMKFTMSLAYMYSALGTGKQKLNHKVHGFLSVFLASAPNQRSMFATISPSVLSHISIAWHLNHFVQYRTSIVLTNCNFHKT